MGLIAKIKELFSAERYIQRAMEAMDKEYSRYAELSGEELLALPDDELLSAVLYRINARHRESGGKTQPHLYERFEDMAPHEQALYAVSELDAVMQEDGGLGIFLLDRDYRFLIPHLSECLREVGAGAHAALFADFVRDNRVDPVRARAFAQNPDNDRAVADFNRAYAGLPSLEAIAVAYIRRNIDRL